MHIVEASSGVPNDRSVISVGATVRRNANRALMSASVNVSARFDWNEKRWLRGAYAYLKKF